MARRRISLQVVALVAGGLVAASNPPVSAAPTWLPDETVSGPAFSLTVNARVAVDRFGNSTAVWGQVALGVGRVQASHRPAGGKWSAPLTISDPARFAQGPDVVVDDFGTVTAAWLAAGAGGANQIESARLPLGGSWSSPTLVGVAELVGPRLAVDDAGTVTAVWLEYRSRYIVRTSSIAPGGTWTVGKDLSDTTVGSSGAQVAVDPATGAAVAVWQTFDGTFSLIYASRRPPNGTWSSAQLVSEAGQNASNTPQVTIDGQGTATVLFGKYFSGHYETYWSSAPSAGPWSTPLALSKPGDPVADFVVTSTSGGEAIATWRQFVGGKYVVFVSTRPAGGAWTAALPLSNGIGDAASLGAGTGPGGTAYVLWHWNPGTGTKLQLAQRPPGGPWSAPLDVAPESTPMLDPVHSIGVDDGGDLAVAYLEGLPTPQTVAVRALDAAGPTITISAPITGQAGTALSYAASATDTWSAVTGYAWSFGDGGTASGPAVSHTYTAVGSYPVTLTVTDAVGNATTRTATTAVAAPVPKIGTFKLTKTKILALSRVVATKTKLKVRLNTPATLKLVFKSKHKHLIKGKNKYVKVVLKKQLPAGLSRITIKAKVKGKVLKPDTYVITGTAKNATGKSPKKKVKLTVVKP